MRLVHFAMPTINRSQFDEVCMELENGVPLSLTHIGRVFGYEFWQLLVHSLTKVTIDLKETDRVIINVGK